MWPVMVYARFLLMLVPWQTTYGVHPLVHRFEKGTLFRVQPSINQWSLGHFIFHFIRVHAHSAMAMDTSYVDDGLAFVSLQEVLANKKQRHLAQAFKDALTPVCSRQWNPRQRERSLPQDCSAIIRVDHHMVGEINTHAFKPRAFELYLAWLDVQSKLCSSASPKATYLQFPTTVAKKQIVLQAPPCGIQVHQGHHWDPALLVAHGA